MGDAVDGEGGRSRQILVQQNVEQAVRPYLEAAGTKAENEDRLLFRWTVTGRMSWWAGYVLVVDLRAGQTERRVVMGSVNAAVQLGW